MFSEEKQIMKKVTINSATADKSSLLKKWGWLAAIWLSSIIALFAVSSVFRFLMTAAGMKLK